MKAWRDTIHDDSNPSLRHAQEKSEGDSSPPTPRKEPMESPDAQEQAVYGMLKQVLQNQITTHDITLSVALTGCAMMLTSACLALYDTDDDIQVHMPYTMTRLKEHLRARQTTPPLHPFTTMQYQEGAAPVAGMDARGLGQSLAQVTNDAIEEYALTPGAAWGIALELTADVLAMLFHQHENTLIELDTMIDETLQPVMLRQMRQSQRETGQG